ncbi:MAG TPA: hypothetical protein VGJ04_12065 [Pirellulales bacterium]|jgi:hypothetical protein
MSSIQALRLLNTWLLCGAACLLFAATAWADPPVHFLHEGILVPGAIGAAQLQRGGPLPGYFQPLEIRAPAGAAISVAVEDQFTQLRPAPLKTAMLIGPVYRLRVTNIPHHEGDEVYPTIEVINRLYPPMGEELRFPVPIELTQNDLVAAMEGKFITRIIYLENPRAAYAREEDPKSQLTLEASPKEDPLVMADRLGRPMAIVRIGGRTPEDVSNPGAEFMYHSPPLLCFAKQPASPPQESRTDLKQPTSNQPADQSTLGADVP